MEAFKFLLVLGAVFAQVQSQGISVPKLPQVPVLPAAPIPAAPIPTAPAAPLDFATIRAAFDSYISQAYPGGLSPELENQSLIIYVQNLVKAIIANPTQAATTLLSGITDLITSSDIRTSLNNGLNMALMMVNTPISQVIEYNGDSDLPDSWNWAEKGAVTPVKNQGSCGSCWAFSTAGALEGMLARSGKPLTSLSPQNLLDCLSPATVYNYTCANGGWPHTSMEWAVNNGLATEDDYPYTGVPSTCQDLTSLNKGLAKGQNIGYATVKAGDIDSMKYALVNYGPIAIAIYANYDLQIFYPNIFPPPVSTLLEELYVYGGPQCSQIALGVNHAVLVVGYKDDYWIVKNEWGTTWGEDGYFRIKMTGDICGVTNYALLPYLK